MAAVAIPSAEHAWIDARVARSARQDRRHRRGVDLLAAPEAAGALRGALLDAGAPPASATRRPRSCASSAGARATASTWATDNLPGEAGIVERAVSFTKGCYVGQEPVARMYHRGHPNRHLRGLRLSGRRRARATP